MSTPIIRAWTNSLILFCCGKNVLAFKDNETGEETPLPYRACTLRANDERNALKSNLSQHRSTDFLCRLCQKRYLSPETIEAWRTLYRALPSRYVKDTKDVLQQVTDFLLERLILEAPLPLRFVVTNLADDDNRADLFVFDQVISSKEPL